MKNPPLQRTDAFQMYLMAKGKKTAHSGLKAPPVRSMYGKARQSSLRLLKQVSTTCQNPNSAVLPLAETCWSAIPKPCFAACAVLSPPRSCARKSHDHAKEIQHTPPQPRCENPLFQDEYADFTQRACALWYQPVRISPQHTPPTIRPVIHVSRSMMNCSPLSKLAAEYGRSRQPQPDSPYLNEYGAPYNALSGEVRAAIADLAALKYEVLQKVGDALATLNISTLKMPTTSRRTIPAF